MYRQILFFVLCALTHSFPRYVSCGLDVNYLAGDPEYRNGVPRTLGCNSKIMKTELTVTNDTFTLIDENNLIATSFSPGKQYTLRMPALGPAGSHSLWDATGGSFSASPGQQNNRAGGTCTRTMNMNSCDSKDVTWTAPDTSAVNFTLICAIPQKARMIRSTFFKEATGKLPVNDACGTAVSNDTSADNTCRNKNLVGSKEQQDYMYMFLIFVWVISIRMYTFDKSASYVGSFFDFVFDGGFLYFAVSNAIESNYRTELYYAIGIYLLFKFQEVNPGWYSNRAAAWKAVKSASYFLLVTFLVLSFLSSWHHWCNGEQTWDQMSGSWASFDSWQGTVPWWALANIWVAYFAFSPGYQAHALLFAFVTAIASASVGGFGGKDAYSDYCTWIQMITSGLFALAWLYHSYKRPQNNEVKDILFSIGVDRSRYVKYSLFVGVVIISVLASGAVTGKGVPISMIFSVVVLVFPLVLAVAKSNSLSLSTIFLVGWFVRSTTYTKQNMRSTGDTNPLRAKVALRL